MLFWPSLQWFHEFFCITHCKILLAKKCISNKKKNSCSYLHKLFYYEFHNTTLTIITWVHFNLIITCLELVGVFFCQIIWFTTMVCCDLTNFLIYRFLWKLLKHYIHSCYFKGAFLQSKAAFTLLLQFPSIFRLPYHDLSTI